MINLSKSYNKNVNVLCKTLREMSFYNRILKMWIKFKKNYFLIKENSMNDLSNKGINENNSCNTRLNEYVNKVIKNIPYNME